MIGPRRLAEMVIASRHEAAQKAIVAKLKVLMPDVTVEAHPGKLDINDVVAKKIAAAPGLAIGWTRIRAERDVAGTFGLRVDWAAYIVAEARADLVTKVATARETIAHAIGAFLLEILEDVDTSTFGLLNASPALPDPAPQFAPVFTVRSFEQGLACYSVTWSQDLGNLGRTVFDGPSPTLQLAGDGDAGLDAGGMPPELVAAFAGSEP